MRKRGKEKRLLIALFVVFIITGIMNNTLGCDCSAPQPSACHYCDDGLWYDMCEGDCLYCGPGQHCYPDESVCDDFEICGQSGNCEACREWTAGAGIGGFYEATDAFICDCCPQISVFYDDDSWVDASGSDTPSDTIVYSWSASGGTWEVNNESTFQWTAPPTLGDIVITVTVNDLPASMTDPCPGSTRDDSAPGEITDTATVILPPGCSTGTQSVTLSSSKVAPTECGTIDGCGVTSSPTYNPQISVDALYNQGNWVFSVVAQVGIPSGPCPSNYINIVDGGETAITEDNYCTIVNSFKNSGGCPRIGENRFSNTACVTQHEDSHYTQFQEQLAIEATALMAKDSVSNMAIVCSDPATKTCQAAKTARESAIRNDVQIAYQNAINNADDEEPAISAARACFEAIADNICDHAANENWNSCEHCD